MHRRAVSVTEARISENKPAYELKQAWISAPFCYFRGKSLVVVRGLTGQKAPAEPLELDLLVLSGRKLTDPGCLMQLFNLGQVVIDSSVPGYLDLMYQQQFAAAGIPCHSVRGQGAFSLKW
jgi:hypothetical protein